MTEPLDKMSLWNEAFITDPNAVKPITGKQYKGNSPKPYWLIQRATQIFGPIGIGWGVDVKSERFERLSETDVLHVAVVSVWFMHEAVRSQTFDQMGGTKAAYLTSKGTMMIDEDAGKKSVTDGMVKCLSMIGFAGDIFSGMWDDSKYVDWAAEQTAKRNGVEPAPPPPAPGPKHRPAKGAIVAPERLPIIQETADAIVEAMTRESVVDAYGYYTSITDPEEKTAIWDLLHSATRSAIKKYGQQLTKEEA